MKFLFSQILMFVLILLIMLYKRLTHFCFSRLTSRSIKDSTYNQLVDTIAKEYNYQEYANPSSLALLEAHHHYKVFHPGDWVLDIGAGPTWSWTDLALKMTRNDENSNRVISNDIAEQTSRRDLQISVRGDFLEEPVQTKIAMNLMDRKLDTVLVDATGDFSGDLEVDGNYTIQVFLQALKFANPYLRKGGTVVFKTLECPKANLVFRQSKLIFNQVYKFQPTSLRIGSPAFFLVLKGHLMTQNFEAVKKFLKQYQGSIKKKVALVEKYRQDFPSWDPIELINNQAKERVIQLKKEGRTNKDIFKIYQDDPFVKIKEILEQIDLIQDQSANPIARIRASQKFHNCESSKIDTLPETQEEFAEYLFNKSEDLFEKKDPKDKHKNIHKQASEKAPLKDGQIYMKNTKVEEQAEKVKDFDYLEEDLYGYSLSEKTKQEMSQQKQKDQNELIKMLKTFPELEQAFNDNQFRETMLKNPVVRSQANQAQLEELERIFKKERTSGKQQFSLDIDDIEKSNELQNKRQQLQDEVLESRREYMQSLQKKEDRYINQKRAKRYLKNKNKF